MYELDSYERYRVGEELEDKYYKQLVKGVIATLLWCILGIEYCILLDMNAVYLGWLVILPVLSTIRAAWLSDTGGIMKSTAIQTFGKDEEEYY